MLRAEFAPGYRVVAAPESHHSKYLLQDTHWRVAPSWAPHCTPQSTQSSPKHQAPAAGGGFPPCPLRASSHGTWFDTSSHLPRAFPSRAGNPVLEQLIVSKESSNTALIPPGGSRAAAGAPLRADGVPPTAARGNLRCPSASGGETRDQLLSRSSEPHLQRLPVWRVRPG